MESIHILPDVHAPPFDYVLQISITYELVVTNHMSDIRKWMLIST